MNTVLVCPPPSSQKQTPETGIMCMVFVWETILGNSAKGVRWEREGQVLAYILSLLV